MKFKKGTSAKNRLDWLSLEFFHQPKGAGKSKINQSAGKCANGSCGGFANIAHPDRDNLAAKIEALTLRQ